MTRPLPELGLEGLAFGAVYHPDQWAEDVWPEDIRLMQEAGVNLVSLAIFSWSQLEMAPGKYDFGWLDRIMDLLHEGGIRVNLGTATATPPIWMVRAHPEMLPTNASGQRLEFGARQTYCPSSPVWRENVARMSRTMAERYGSHPALAMWHVSHEYGDHVGSCWCPVSSAHFRGWLEARYGTIAELNRAWGTTSWGLSHSAFDQIEAPRTAVGPINPAQLLDFQRFSSDALFELFEIETEILRAVTPAVALSTNFISLRRDADYWKFAAEVDMVTDNAYPDPSDPLTHVPAALNYDLMRSLRGGQPWLLLEHSTSAVSWRDVNPPKSPGHTRVTALQAVAHGSDGVLFNQWRQPVFGVEKYHSAILGHRGENSRSFRESVELAAELQKLDAVRGTRVRASVGLVVDWDAWWASSAPEALPSQRMSWLEQTRAWHAGLFALGHNVDVLPAEGPFEDYDLVVVPNLYLTTDAQAQALEAYVAAGGRLVVGPFSGVVDETETVHPGGAPGPLRALLGVEVDETWPIDDGRTETVQLADAEYQNAIWSEWIEVTAGEFAAVVIAEYSSGELAGKPAVTRRAHGDGFAWYVSSVLEPAGTRALLRDVLTAAGLPTRDNHEPNLETVTRTDGATDFTFVLNHGKEAITVTVPVGATDLLTGATVTDTLTLARFGAAVLVTPSETAAPFFTTPTHRK